MRKELADVIALTLCGKTAEARQVLAARDGWVTYYRDYRDVHTTIDRWRKDNEKLYDDVQPVMVPVKLLWPMREYTWSREDARLSPAGWDELKASLKRKGWDKNDPLHLYIGQEGGEKVGEGNHRLALAREIGLREAPVRFHFHTGRVRKSPQHPPLPEPPKKPKWKAPDKPPRELSPEEEARVEEIMKLLGL
jgi:hypothetical protein